MAGFTRQIRGFGQSTSNTTNSTNTSSDNYSYYIRNEDQESYQHKNASWDPGRSFWQGTRWINRRRECRLQSSDRSRRWLAGRWKKVRYA